MAPNARAALRCMLLRQRRRAVRRFRWTRPDRSASTAWSGRRRLRLPVNPNLIRQQIESGIIYCLSAACMANQPRKRPGAAEQFPDSHRSEWTNVRRSKTDIIASTEHPGGIGESDAADRTGARNAVFCAHRPALRALPLKLA